MHNASLFLPETITEALRDDLAAALRAIADELDGKFISAKAAAGGRHDCRLHLRIVFDVAAPIIQAVVSET